MIRASGLSVAEASRKPGYVESVAATIGLSSARLDANTARIAAPPQAHISLITQSVVGP